MLHYTQPAGWKEVLELMNMPSAYPDLLEMERLGSEFALSPCPPATRAVRKRNPRFEATELELRIDTFSRGSSLCSLPGAGLCKVATWA